MDDSDEKRSRSIPSRTKIGKRTAAIKEHPYLGAPLVLFGGLITVPFWGYRNTSLAMIDIMLADSPRVEYHDNDGKITKRDIEEAIKRDEALQERKKTHRGIGANLSNRIDTDKFVEESKKSTN